MCIYEKRSLKMNESFMLEETKHDTREGQRFTRACAFLAESSTFRLLFLPTSFYRKIIMLNFIIVPSLNASNQSFGNYFDRAGRWSTFPAYHLLPSIDKHTVLLNAKRSRLPPPLWCKCQAIFFGNIHQTGDQREVSFFFFWMILGIRIYFGLFYLLRSSECYGPIKKKKTYYFGSKLLPFSK